MRVKGLLCSFRNAYNEWIKYDIEKLEQSKCGCVIMWWHNRPARTVESEPIEIIEDLKNEISENGFFYYFCKSYDTITYAFKVKDIIDIRLDLLQPHDFLPDDWKGCEWYHQLSGYSMTKQPARIFFKTFEIIELTGNFKLTDLDLGKNKLRPLNLNPVYDFSKELRQFLQRP